MKQMNPWCYATATMDICPLFDYCAGKKKPGNPDDFAEEQSETCFERRGEWAMYRNKYNEDDPTFYEVPEPPFEEPPEPWDEYVPEDDFEPADFADFEDVDTWDGGGDV